MSAPPAAAHANSFDFLRLALALAVVCGHAFPLGGFGSDPFYWWSGQRLALHELSLQGFFILSGYLLARSLAHQPSLARFTLRRAFRILPGFWCALLVTSFVLTPAITAIFYPGQHGYFESLTLSNYNALSYVTRNVLLWSKQGSLCPLFAANPLPMIVNGSLWSVFFEVLCYAGLGLAAWLGLLRCPRAVFGIFGLLYAPLLVQLVHPIPTPPFEPAWGKMLHIALHPAGSNVVLAFAAGVVAHFLARDRSFWNARWFVIALCAFAAALPLSGARLACPLAFAYALLYLGEKLPWRGCARFGDFSYGIYIYAFPLQQCLAQLGVHRLGFWFYLGASLVLSIGAGVLSWHLIEKHAITLGQRVIAALGRRSLAEAAVALPLVTCAAGRSAADQKH